MDFIVSILKKPLVSILFPCYNAEPFLKYSLESIINQDYENLEIICVNDGSSDRTLDILNKYKKSDDRIIIINNLNILYLFCLFINLNINNISIMIISINIDIIIILTFDLS